ncbi:hypothetical protein MMC25_004712 [Agyrium rufum]|nr:hypothetical protein [Agyrium rufum]
MYTSLLLRRHLSPFRLNPPQINFICSTRRIRGKQTGAIYTAPPQTVPQPRTGEGSSHGFHRQLFAISEYSPGSAFFPPEGSHVFLKLQSFLRAQYSAFGFREVITPLLYKQTLWEKSGHWANYADDMFAVVGRGASRDAHDPDIEHGKDEKLGLKPMNCPGHCLLFDMKLKSYRDLPIRYADFSALHRNELTGTLSGLTRGRRFHQDDGHIFCTPEQVGDEIRSTLAFVNIVYNTFKLGDLKFVLSTRPEEKYLGNAEEWENAETQLKEALKQTGSPWTMNPGDGAFYGPKIDIVLSDKSGKEHQTATIQLDFQMPKQLDLKYALPHSDNNGTYMARPVLIHRAILGSLERFLALLIDHYDSRWPFWLSPRQANILTISRSHDSYAALVANRLTGAVSGLPATPRSLQEHTFAIDSDLSDRTLGKKIKLAEKSRYSFIIIVGDNEVATNTVNVRFAAQDTAEPIMTILSRILGESPAGNQQDLKKGIQLNIVQLEKLFMTLEKEFL